MQSIAKLLSHPGDLSEAPPINGVRPGQCPCCGAGCGVPGALVIIGHGGRRGGAWTMEDAQPCGATTRAHRTSLPVGIPADLIPPGEPTPPIPPWPQHICPSAPGASTDDLLSLDLVERRPAALRAGRHPGVRAHGGGYGAPHPGCACSLGHATKARHSARGGAT